MDRSLVLRARSGDPFIDWTFSRFLEFLKKTKVYKVRDLRDPDNRRCKLKGYFNEKDPENGIPCNEIFLNPWKFPRHPVVKTLIHELAHGICPNVSERSILRVEQILWKKFTLAQKEILVNFVPKYCVKKQPK